MTDLIWVITSSVLIIAIVAIRAALGKRMSAGLRYALWGLVLIRLLIPGTVFSSPVSVETAAQKTEVVQNMEAVREVSAIARTETGSVVGQLRRPSAETAQQGQTSPVQPMPKTEAPAIPAATQKPQTAEEKVPQTAVILNEATPERFVRMQKTLELRDILNIIWYTGMGLAAAYFITANLRFYLKLRGKRERIEAGIGCPVYKVEGLTSSCLFLNSIYISKETAEDPEKLRYVLAHERAHRRHGDGIFALLRSAAIVLHWYNPLVWFAAILSRRDSEIFADAGAIAAVGDEEREQYGRALIELSTKASVYAPIACAATMMTSGKAELKRRVKNIAKRRRMGFAIAAAVLVLALAAVGCSFIGGQKKPDENGPKTTEAPTEVAKPTLEPTAVPTEAPLPDDPEDIGDCIKDAEVLLFIPFGDDDECAGYDFARDGGATEDSGPQAFWISDGKIYLLDTVKKRVIVSDNGAINYIMLPETVRCPELETIVVIDDKLYACGIDINESEEILVFDMSGNVVERIAIPAGVKADGGVYYLSETEGSLALVDHQMTTWKLNDGSFDKIAKCTVDKNTENEMTIRQEDLVITIKPGADTHPALFMIRDGSVYTKVIVYDPTIPESGSEMCFRVYDYEGDLIGLTAVDCRNARVPYPDCPLFVDPDGTLYVMCWMQDGVYITKPNLRLTYTSNLGEPTEAPDHGLSEDAAKLAAFFELEDENGVKNGTKLFPSYDVHDVSTWDTDKWKNDVLVWDENGRLTELHIPYYRGYPYVGSIEIKGFSELRSVIFEPNTITDTVTVSDCPKLELLSICSCDEIYVRNTAKIKEYAFTADLIDCDLIDTDPEQGTVEKYRVLLRSGENCKGVCFCVKAFYNELYTFIRAYYDFEYSFAGWFDETGERSFALPEVYFSEIGHLPENGLRLTAKAVKSYDKFPMHSGEAPEASPILGILDNGVPAVFDIDFDGLDDTITAELKGKESEGTSEVVITITRGACPDEPFVYSIPGVFEYVAAYVLDCDTSDNRLDVLLNAHGWEGTTAFLRAFRVDPEGVSIVTRSTYVGNIYIDGSFSEADVFDATKGIPVSIITETFGSQVITAWMTVTENGFERLTPFRFNEPTEYNYGYMELLRDMEVTVIKDGVPGEKITLHKGEIVSAYETDEMSYIDMILQDGTIVRADLDVSGLADPRINGIDQGEYFKVYYGG